MKAKKITVIGGGVIGITTAISLQEHGYKTTLITHLRADESHPHGSLPEFATLFPAACIVPHTVEMADLLEVFDISQREFMHLATIPEAGVRWQPHYELTAESSVEIPAHTRVLSHCEAFGSSRDHLPFDAALGHRVYGWVADALFAETPIYIRYLYRRYLSGGGELETRKIERDEKTSSGRCCQLHWTLVPFVV